MQILPLIIMKQRYFEPPYLKGSMREVQRNTLQKAGEKSDKNLPLL